MKRIIISIAALVLCNISGAQVFPLLNVSRDAGRMSMGLTSEPDAATFSLEDKTVEAGASYTSWQPSGLGESIIGAGCLGHFGKFGASLSYKSYGEKEYALVNDNGIQTGTFKPSGSAIGMNVAYALNANLSFGLGIRLASETLAKDVKASGTGFDIYAAYCKDALAAGLSVCNLGGSLDFGSGKQSLPALVRANAAYALPFNLNLAAEFDYLLCGEVMGGAGAEYVIADMVALRAGYHFGGGDSAIASYLALGAGFKFAGITLDACFLLASDTLSGTMCFGLGYSF